jgi:hypothetical protein
MESPMLDEPQHLAPGPWTRHLGCPICRILAAAEGQTLAVAVDLMQVACTVPCRCLHVRHRALCLHPHTPAGCQGFHAQEGGDNHASLP